MPNTAQITCFIELCRHESYTKAAESLYISQPALSRHISLLEQELGVKLVKRNKKKFQLTPEGNAFLKLAQNFHKEQQDFELASHNLKTHHTSVLKLGIAEDFPVTNILQALDDMRERYPDLLIECNVYHQQTQLLSGLISDSLDAALGFRSELGSFSSLNYEMIAINYIAILVSDRHRFWGRKSIDPEELRWERVFIPVQELDPGSFIATLNFLQRYDVYVPSGNQDRCTVEQILRVADGSCVSLTHIYGTDLVKTISANFARIPIRNSDIHYGDITLAYHNESPEIRALNECLHKAFPQLEIG